MSERRTIVVLPDGNRCIELQQDFVGGSETQVVVSYHEILNIETDPMALGKKINVNDFKHNWIGQVVGLSQVESGR